MQGDPGAAPALSMRLAKRADAGAIADVLLAARAASAFPGVHDEVETRAWARDALLAELEVWVAESDGCLVGFAALRGAVLEHLYVEPYAQGRGVGTSLLSAAKQLRPEGLRLWVFQRNTGARRFYERHGFRLVELTDGKGNEEREPDALLEWKPG